MPALDRLPLRGDAGAFNVIVESPAHARMKLKYEPALGTLVVSRTLTVGLEYPHDWGFFPSTRADDGNPLAVMVLNDCSTFPGILLPTRPIGVLCVRRKRQRGSSRERDDRVLAVPVNAPRFAELDDARALPVAVRDEIEDFFHCTAFHDDQDLEFAGWSGPKPALVTIESAAARFKKAG